MLIGKNTLSLAFMPDWLAVCKLSGLSGVDFGGGLVFLCKTRDEISLVCEEDRVPAGALAVERGWLAFRVAGTLDFSMTGILADLASTLAESEISLFAVSTYDTDYILVKQENASEACNALLESGYEITNSNRTE